MHVARPCAVWKSLTKCLLCEDEGSVGSFADGAGGAAEFSRNPVLGCTWHSGWRLLRGLADRHGNAKLSACAATEGACEMASNRTNMSHDAPQKHVITVTLLWRLSRSVKQWLISLSKGFQNVTRRMLWNIYILKVFANLLLSFIIQHYCIMLMWSNF